MIGTLTKMLMISLCLLSATAQSQGQGQSPPEWVTRYESAIRKLEELAKPAENGIVVTGNSNVVMWKSLKSALAPLPVISRGFGGSTIEELNYYLDRIVLAYKPRAVVVHEGENDHAEGYSSEEIAQRHADVVARIKAQNADTRVYVIGLKPSPQRAHLWDQFQETNTLLEEMCAVENRCRYIPPPAGLLDANGKPRPELYSDRLHLNDAGYKVWDEAIAPVILQSELSDDRVPRPPASFETNN